MRFRQTLRLPEEGKKVPIAAPAGRDSAWEISQRCAGSACRAEFCIMQRLLQPLSGVAQEASYPLGLLSCVQAQSQRLSPAKGVSPTEYNGACWADMYRPEARGLKIAGRDCKLLRAENSPSTLSQRGRAS